MPLTVVTAVMSAIKSGNRENLIRCVRSVAALKTEHEHLIYDGGSTDGTVELLRELETEINNSTVPLFSTPIFSHPTLRVVSEPDTGIYNALNKGVRDAHGDWFYVLGCDDHISHPEVLDRLIAEAGDAEIIATDVESARGVRAIAPSDILLSTPYCHQGVLMRTDLVRRLGGFDERYKIAADYRLILDAHLAGCRVSYRSGADNIFATFGVGGLSETDIPLVDREFASIVAEKFGLDPTKAALYRQRKYLPLHIARRFWFNRDPALRASARRLPRAYLGYCLRGGLTAH